MALSLDTPFSVEAMNSELRDALNDSAIGVVTILFGLLVAGSAFNSAFATSLWRIPVAGAVLQAMTGAINHVYDRVSE